MARTRFRSACSDHPARALPAAALRAVLREGYTRPGSPRDVLAGLVVGIVALPLAMALAIAVGVAAAARPLHRDRRRLRRARCSAARARRSPARPPRSSSSWRRSTPSFGLAGLLLSRAASAALMLIAMGLAAAGAADRVHPASGHHRLHRRHRHGDRDPAAQGPLRPAARQHARALPRARRRRCSQARGTATRLGAGRSAASTLALLIAAAAADTSACRRRWWRCRWRRCWRSRSTTSCPGSHVATIAHAASTPRSTATCVHGIPPLPPLPLLPWHCPGPAASRCELTSRRCASCCRRRSRSRCWAPSSRCCRRWSPTAWPAPGTIPTPSCWRWASATSSRRSSAASPPPAPSRAPPPTSARARARRSRR